MKNSIATINTSIKQIPALFNKIKHSQETTIINFGCGRYPDLVAEKLDNTIINYDPLFDNADNQNSQVITDVSALYSLAESIEGEKVVMCANVLNVLTDEFLEDVIEELNGLHYVGCKICISIYEGNKTGQGSPTTKGYQRNEKAVDYLKMFHNGIVERKGNIITIS